MGQTWQSARESDTRRQSNPAAKELLSGAQGMEVCKYFMLAKEDAELGKQVCLLAGLFVCNL